jgi:hypothetical protein
LSGPAGRAASATETSPVRHSYDEGDESYCSGGCAKDWPPYTTNGTPQAGDGVDASELTTFKRDDGEYNRNKVMGGIETYYKNLIVKWTGHRHFTPGNRCTKTTFV